MFYKHYMLSGGKLLKSRSLNILNPESVQIAVLEYGNRLVVYNFEYGFGRLAGLQALALAALFGLEINPLYVMLFCHGMRNLADLHFNGVALNLNIGYVLLFACVDCVRLKQRHFVAAAYRRYAGKLNYAYKITAMLA